MALSPPAYLLRARDLLREAEPGRWAWFASDSWSADYVDSVRLELLKATYRLEPASHAALYEAGAKAAAALDLDLPLTFYQSEGEGGMNAALYFVPGEAHVVLRGPVLSALTGAELLALIGHELAHHRLQTCEGGTLRVATELIESIAGHAGAAPSHLTTALRMRRYTEIFADRGSHLVTSNPADIIACLVKVNTGLTEVDPAAYLRQAEEIFAKKAFSTQALSHPETFVRARAIALWHERGEAAEPEVAAMVQGLLTLDALDLLDQRALAKTTREVVQQLLAPPWFRSDAVVAHARAFFPDLAAEAAPPPFTGGAALDPSVQEYLAYVLLDFAVVDEALGEVAVAHALQSAAALGVADTFDRVAREELRLTKKALEELKKGAPELLSRAALQQAELL